MAGRNVIEYRYHCVECNKSVRFSASDLLTEDEVPPNANAFLKEHFTHTIRCQKIVEVQSQD